MTKRMGRFGSMDGKVREMWRIEAEELDVEIEDSGGIYIPVSRKDLMFDMRSREDADGDKSIIGSGLLAGAFRFTAKAGLLAMFEADVL